MARLPQAHSASPTAAGAQLPGFINRGPLHAGATRALRQESHTLTFHVRTHQVHVLITRTASADTPQGLFLSLRPESRSDRHISLLRLQPIGTENLTHNQKKVCFRSTGTMPSPVAAYTSTSTCHGAMRPPPDPAQTRGAADRGPARGGRPQRGATCKGWISEAWLSLASSIISFTW